jgi:hypothetical protein
MNLGATCKTLKPKLSRSDVLVVAGKRVTIQIPEKTGSQMAFRLADEP